MAEKILILGAAGRLGRACAIAFRDAGWEVVSCVRPGAGIRAVERTTVVEEDTLDRESVLEAAKGVSVVLDAVNTPFAQWPKTVLPQTEIAIAAAEAAGATLIFPGNLFVYGKDLPERIDENTPMHAQSVKGRLRLEAESRIGQASARGVRSIIVRAGDFYGGTNYGSWFDLVIARDIDMGVVRYPGPLMIPHAWAYLPDLARSIVRLAEVRGSLKPFEVFGFPGHPATGGQLLTAIHAAVSKPLKRRTFPWWLLKMLSPFMSQWREVTEVSHLWKLPHRIEGDKLKAAIGEIPETPYAEAVRDALDALGMRGFPQKPPGPALS